MKVGSRLQRAVRTMDQAHPTAGCRNMHAVMAHYRYSVRVHAPVDRHELKRRGEGVVSEIDERSTGGLVDQPVHGRVRG